jgi:hypothetical protein
MPALPSRTSRSSIKARNGKTSTVTLGLSLCCILSRIAAASRSSVLPLPIGSTTISRLIPYTIASRACFCSGDLYVSRLLGERLSTFRTAISRLASLLRASWLCSVAAAAVAAASLCNPSADSLALFCSLSCPLSCLLACLLPPLQGCFSSSSRLPRLLALLCSISLPISLPAADPTEARPRKAC